MTTIYDLIEVTGIAENTTYSFAAGNLLGVIDGATGADLNDGEFDEGDSIVIGGVSYALILYKNHPALADLHLKTAQTAASIRAAKATCRPSS